MSLPHEPGLEDQLRRALHDHAAQIVPSDDGLARIRQEIAHRSDRRRPWSWRGASGARGATTDRRPSGARARPIVTAAAAAVAAAAVVALPVALHNRDDAPHRGAAASHGHVIGERPPSIPPRTNPGPPISADSPPAASAVADPTPGAGGPPRRDRTPEATPDASLTSWPYQSVTEASRHAGSDARLRQPDSLATGFVGQFVPADTLVAGRTTKGSGDDLVVTVQRKDSGRVVSLVHLVPVDTSSATYLVKDATSPGLTVSAGAAVNDAPTVTLNGKFSVKSGSSARLWAGIGAPNASGDITPSDNSTAAPTGSSPWALTVTPTPVLASGGVVAVWAVDARGNVVEFAAAPAP